jgi:hypothetical protein
MIKNASQYSKVYNLNEVLESLYLDYINDFLTPDGWASYYNLNITKEEAESILHVAREVYKRNNN